MEIAAIEKVTIPAGLSLISLHQVLQNMTTEIKDIKIFAVYIPPYNRKTSLIHRTGSSSR
jgi:hypothetical protein